NPNTIEVLYQGTPVWINYVDPENCAADVSSMLLPSETLKVHVRDLVEGKEISNNIPKQVLSGRL
ncbi:MAG: small, acid-soluble spore protein, H family, partial [Hyphomonadaceae bacterium]|nr:small, acid-soluble spore protein, H family [Clostridia bacterium]